jgi:hypothetical protein
MAGWGGANQLPAGDYYVQITDVKPVMGKDFNDKTKEKPQYEWKADAFMPDGRWQTQTLWTPQSFTPPDQEATAKFISGLNRIVRACLSPMPQSADEARAWDQKRLIGRGFILRMDQDPERPQQLVKRYLPLTFAHRALLPPTIGQVMANMGIAQPQAQAPQAAVPTQPQAVAPAPAAPQPQLVGAGVTGDDNYAQ